MILPTVASAQSPDSATYSDIGIERLVERARVARARDAAGIDNYEARLRQRIYVGLTALRFRRERGLFEHERIARVRWSADGDQVIQWEGVRTAIPIAGLDTGRDQGPTVRLAISDSSGSVSAGQEFEQDMAEDLLDETTMPGFDFEPGGDRLMFGPEDDGEAWALHPLSDTAAGHYRYRAGDTVTVTLPANERVIDLVEVLVEPRRATFRLVAGSLWFDDESGALVRATYKPARPYDLAVDEAEDGDDVPGFLQPLEAEIEYVTVEYSLQEFSYWLPRRFAFQGEARLGGLARVPITFEWGLTEYVVNEEESELLGAGPLPEGWRRQLNVDTDSLGNATRVTVIVPSVEELRDFPGLSDDFGERSPSGFSDGEIRELQGRLQGLLPTYQRFRPRLAFGLTDGLVRFNRVEGVSLGAGATVPLGPEAGLDVEARFGLADQEPTLAVGVERGPEARRWRVEGYRRLASMSDIQDPFDLSSTLSHLILGSDRAQYYRALGGGLGFRRIGERVRFSATAFGERHSAVGLNSEFSLRGQISDREVEPVFAASEIDLYGARGRVDWFRGIDPNGLILTAAMTGEVGRGDVSYERLTGAASISHPLPLGLVGALQFDAGTSWGSAPIQRQYFIGGSKTLRGFDSNTLFGREYWTGRAEVATGFAAARIALFSDIGWAGRRGTSSWDDRLQAVGAGLSLLDGLFRVDLAKDVLGGRGWKLHAYVDGIF